MHRIAVTRMRRTAGAAITSSDGRPSNDTETEAPRMQRRRISDEVYGRLWQDHSALTAAGCGRGLT